MGGVDLYAAPAERWINGRLYIDPIGVIRDCPLSAWKGEDGRCRWCDEELTGRKTAWCSQACSDQADEQHSWTRVRIAAIRRDHATCLRCGNRGWSATDQRWLTHIATMPKSHLDRYARAGLDREREYYLRLRRTAIKLEVNHVRPMRVSGSNRPWFSCSHHLEGLETLCHYCHVIETRLQIVSTRSTRTTPGASMRTIACWEDRHELCWAHNPATEWVEFTNCTCGCHGEPWASMLPEPSLLDASA